MLFKQIYNWIKYKTLPPSILFKNRLFIERDSKHKRIFNNIGLTFRNLKWNNYETSSTQPRFKFQYGKFFSFTVVFIFCLFLLLKFQNYYSFSYLYNNVFFIFWIGLDTFDYYLSFLFWLAIISLNLIFKLLQSYFFYSSFSLNNKFQKPEDVFFKAQLKSKHFANSNISKKDYKWFILNWLNNDKISQGNSRSEFKILTNLFESSFDKIWWTQNSDLFAKLFKLTHFLNLNQNFLSLFHLQLKLNQIQLKNGNFLLFYINNTSLFNKYTPVIMSYLLKKNVNYFDNKLASNPSIFFLNTKFDWNLCHIIDSNGMHNNLTKKINGFFYFNDLTFNQTNFFTEKINYLNIMNPAITNQIHSAKWNRWLYKYSILHRKVFKNSHKITLSKKLLNSGFYNIDLSKKNLWYSELLNKYTNKNVLHFASNLLYSNFSQSIDIETYQNYTNFSLNNHSSGSNINFLNLYETSFFWFLKRFYLFSGLKSNFNSSNVFLKNNLNYEKKNDLSLVKHFLSNSFLLNSLNFNLGVFNYFSDQNETIFCNSQNVNFNKDSHLMFNDLDFFDKDSLEILCWIVTPTSLVSKNYLKTPYFNYFNNFETNVDFKKIKFNSFTLNKESKRDLNYFFLYSLHNNDIQYLNDLITFFFYINK